MEVQICLFVCLWVTLSWSLENLIYRKIPISSPGVYFTKWILTPGVYKKEASICTGLLFILHQPSPGHYLVRVPVQCFCRPTKFQFKGYCKPLPQNGSYWPGETLWLCDYCIILKSMGDITCMYYLRYIVKQHPLHNPCTIYRC